MNNNSSHNCKLEQINKLVREGCDRRDACKAFGMELDELDVESNLALMTQSRVPVSIEELIDKATPRALEVVLDIMDGNVVDCRPSDRLKAAQIILERKGTLPSNLSNAMADRLARMKMVKENILNTREVVPVIELQAA